MKPGILFVADDPAKRVHSVGTRLNPEENAELEALASARHVTPGELLRTLLKEEAARTRGRGGASKELEEIVGVRILLLTLMKPLLSGKQLTPEAIDKVNATVKQMKTEVAAAIVAGEQT